MRIDFVTFGSDGEEHVLARANFTHIPRIGETVVLNNLRLRKDEELPLHEQRVEHQVVWDVIDVTYEMDAHFTMGKERGKGATKDDPKWVKGEPVLDDDVEVKVWLTPPHGEQAWSGLDRAPAPESLTTRIAIAITSLEDAAKESGDDGVLSRGIALLENIRARRE